MRLINIQTTPMLINTRVTDAQIDLQYNPSKLTIERQRNGLSIDSEPAVLQIDNTEFYNSLGLKSSFTFNKEIEQRAKQSALESVERYVQEGNMMLDAGAGSIPRIAYQRYAQRVSVDTVLAFLPAKPEISWQKQQLDIQYVPDELDMIWDIGKPEYEFSPAKVDVSVLQRNQVKIDYIGQPNYFPKSWAPGIGTGNQLDQKI